MRTLPRPVDVARCVAVASVAAALQGCPAHIDTSRAVVRAVTFTGVRQVDEDALRERLAIRETAYFPSNRPSWMRWWRWWWREPEYFDEGAVTRDRLRVQRYLQARGFYDATASQPTLTRDGEGRLTVDFPVFEGLPTVVADVRLRGCEEGERPLLPADACQRIRDHLDLAPGSRFDEAVFARDREQVVDYTREAGYATATVIPQAVVDPNQRLAWVEYTLRPGPRSRFGRVRLLTPPGRTEATGDELPDGLPTRPILSAMGIDTGAPYSRTAVARAQQALFNLGVFGIARVEEAVRPDGTVDLDVTLSPARRWRFRLGFGAEVDTSRSNVHALASFDHRNFLGGMRRLRIDLRPQLYAPGFGSGSSDVFEPGLVSSLEIQQPEIGPHITGIAGVGLEVGPDPINPQVAFRQVFRWSLGLEARLYSSITGSFNLRGTSVVNCPYRGLIYDDADCGSREGKATLIANDPILRQQFFDRTYLYFDQVITWDRRDNPAAPTRGTVLTLNLAEGTRSPVSDYAFLRTLLEFRGYLPVRRGLTLAGRATFGAIVGSSVYCNPYRADGTLDPDVSCGDTQHRWYWPVPPELRFYSGGNQSNRGYPNGRVGMLGASAARGANGVSYDDRGSMVAIGGTAVWEASLELRWQPSALGVVLFLDASNVAGIDPSPFLSPVGVNGGPAPAVGREVVDCPVTDRNQVADRASCVAPPGARYGVRLPAAPPPQPLGAAVGSLVDVSSWDAFVQALHPSVGIGLRYATPIGPLRLDLGIRLADLGCSTAARNVAAQNGAVRSGQPAYYVLASPRCDFLWWDTIPATLHFSIGEAY